MMNDIKGEELIFPLKEIRVRGNLTLSQKILEDNVNQLYRSMSRLKEEFGIRTYNRDADKILLSFWQAGGKQKNTAPQLRWQITRGKKNIYFTVSLFETIQEQKKNFEIIVGLLKSVEHLPVYKEIITTEIKRVQINARNKATHKLLQHINEVGQSFMLEPILKNYSTVTGEENGYPIGG
ncbi:MAG: hypothetical protein KGV56_05300 [Gammaproteobacteria bacterium]|nr:hypothetical protein [Gammaproteobacteria bacterium]